MSVTMNGKHLGKFVAEREFAAIYPQVEAAHRVLHEKSGPGNDFLGWLDLPVDYDKEEFARIKAAAEKIKRNSDVLVVIGIGGSYLGARAAIEALRGTLYNAKKKDTPEIYFVGQLHQPGVPRRRHRPVRRARFLGEHHLQVRHHDGAGRRLPRVQGPA